jgi:hypothetical protein
MKYKYLLSLIIVVASVMTSCESFLREEPPTFISLSNFYQTAGDARTACDAIYRVLNDGASNPIYGRWWPAIDLATDDVVSKVNRTHFNEWFTHTIHPSHAWLESWGQYQGFWTGISRANDVIDNVPNIEMDEAEKNAIIGEARALRALYYLHLVKTWGDMPIITASVTSSDIFEQPRSSVDDVYNQVIIPDLQYAEENCKDELHTGRVTKWTAKIILADVYLTRAGWRRTSQGELVQGDAINWRLARDKAEDIILNSPHALNTMPLIDGADTTVAYGVAWDGSNPFTVESMLESAAINQAGFGSILSRECGPNSTGTKYWGTSGNKPFQQEGINTTVLQMRFPGEPASVGKYIPTPDLWNAFENGDERRDWSLMTRYTTSTGDTYVTQPTLRKYVDMDYYLGLENTSFGNTNNNFILYRYADALLIYAEAANQISPQSDGNPAYNALNEIRARAGLAPLSGLSQDGFQKAVWKERRCEFNGECKRRFDLIRTNRLASETTDIQLDWTANEGSLTDYRNVNTLFTGTLPWPDHEWLMPLPQLEIELNSDSDWIQNAGY